MVSIGTERFQPESNDENNGKLVIELCYMCGTQGDIDEHRRIFHVDYLHWDNWNDASYELMSTMLECMEDFGVDDSTWGSVYDCTLFATEDLLNETGQPEPASLGLRVTILDIMTHDDDMHDDYDEYVNDDDDADVDYDAIYPEDEEVDEIKEEEDEEVINAWRETAKSALVKSGVKFVKFSTYIEDYHLGNCCSICLEEFGDDQDMMELDDDDDRQVKMKKDDEAIALLPCKHVLHGECVVSWFLNGDSDPTCPLCRYELLAPLFAAHSSLA